MGYLPQTNQFPITVKRRPVSYTLVYDKTNIPGCIFAPYPVCRDRKQALIKGGQHKEHLFRIVPNF